MCFDGLWFKNLVECCLVLKTNFGEKLKFGWLFDGFEKCTKKWFGI